MNARKMCSSCDRFIAHAGLDVPDFTCRQSARKRRVVAKPHGLVGCISQDPADGFDWLAEQRIPLVVAAQQPGRVRVDLPPPREVGASQFNPIWMRRQIARDSPSDL